MNKNVFAFLVDASRVNGTSAFSTGLKSSFKVQDCLEEVFFLSKENCQLQTEKSCRHVIGIIGGSAKAD
jgi:hypothetical protein